MPVAVWLPAQLAQLSLTRAPPRRTRCLIHAGSWERLGTRTPLARGVVRKCPSPEAPNAPPPRPGRGWRRPPAGLDAPIAVVDLEAFDANALDMVRRAGGTPIRVASKSVRCRELLRRVLAVPGYAGVLAYSLREALWLADGDVSGQRRRRRRLSLGGSRCHCCARVVRVAGRRGDADGGLGGAARLRRLRGRRPRAGPRLRVCLDLDASLRLFGGRVHLGVRRSPVHTPAEAAALARAVAARPGFRLVGLMAYEAQVAGVGDSPPGRPLRGHGRTRHAVACLCGRSPSGARPWSRLFPAVSPLEFVNGGGTGSLERTSREPWVTELRGRFRALWPDAVRRLPRLHAAPMRRSSPCRSFAVPAPVS